MKFLGVGIQGSKFGVWVVNLDSRPYAQGPRTRTPHIAAQTPKMVSSSFQDPPRWVNTTICSRTLEKSKRVVFFFLGGGFLSK